MVVYSRSKTMQNALKGAFCIVFSLPYTTFSPCRLMDATDRWLLWVWLHYAFESKSNFKCFNSPSVYIQEMVMSQSSYAKIAGLQSEVGRVVVTRVAGSELEYKRVLNMYRKDMACSVNNIRREQVKMRLRMGRYVKKLKQTRIENAKRLKEEQRRDQERAALEELHIRLKLEAAGKPPEHPKSQAEAQQQSVGEEGQESERTGLPEIVIGEGPVYIQTGTVHEPDEQLWGQEQTEENEHTIKQKRKSRMESRPFSPMLPMINEDAEKENDALNDIEEKKEDHVCESGDGDAGRVSVPDVLSDEIMSISSTDIKRKKRKDVSFSDIIKLKYTGTKHLFDLVHILAKKHGIPDVVDKVPDPRDNVVLRGSTNDSLRLQAAVLYPMKYGYGAEEEEKEDSKPINDGAIKSPGPTGSHSTVAESDSDVNYDSDISTDDKSTRSRKLSLEKRRAIYLSGRHSKSVNDSDYVFLPELGENPEKYTKIKSRDRSMPELAEKVSRIKQEQLGRLGSGSLSPHKPSSSRSSKSLPAALRHSGKPDDKVSWTQAFGLLRAIHSLDDI